MRKLMIATSLLAAGSVQGAPLVDIYGGVYTGQTALSGVISSGTGDADVEDDLGYDDGRQTVIYLGLEHAVPVLPNLRLKHSTLSDEARGEVQNGFTFGGQPFVATTNVVSSFDLDYTDLTLYYSPLDNVVKVDLGITARQIDADDAAIPGQRFHPTLPGVQAGRGAVQQQDRLGVIARAFVAQVHLHAVEGDEPRGRRRPFRSQRFDAAVGLPYRGQRQHPKQQRQPEAGAQPRPAFHRVPAPRIRWGRA